MRPDDFSCVFGKYKHSALEDVVESCEFSGICQIDLVEDKHVTVLHRDSQRTVLKSHLRRFTDCCCSESEVTGELRKFKTAAQGERLNRPVKSSTSL